MGEDAGQAGRRHNFWFFGSFAGPLGVPDADSRPGPVQPALTTAPSQRHPALTTAPSQRQAAAPHLRHLPALLRVVHAACGEDQAVGAVDAKPHAAAELVQLENVVGRTLGRPPRRKGRHRTVLRRPCCRCGRLDAAAAPGHPAQRMRQDGKRSVRLASKGNKSRQRPVSPPRAVRGRAVRGRCVGRPWQACKLMPVHCKAKKTAPWGLGGRGQGPRVLPQLGVPSLAARLPARSAGC